MCYQTNLAEHHLRVPWAGCPGGDDVTVANDTRYYPQHLNSGHCSTFDVEYAELLLALVVVEMFGAAATVLLVDDATESQHSEVLR